jgi:hypothetical protein
MDILYWWQEVAVQENGLMLDQNILDLKDQTCIKFTEWATNFIFCVKFRNSIFSHYVLMPVK